MKLAGKTCFSVLAGTVALVAVTALALVYRSPIAPIGRPEPGTFPASQAAKGRVLAAIGDCAVCHTKDGGTPFAGGRALATPFGTLYATNITPDEATGVGNWSSAAFRRAMKEGVSRTGVHLYPALPYEHYTHVSDEDLDTIYAFLMTLRPVHSVAPANRLMFPLGFRPLLVGWKMLFLHKEPFRPVEGRSQEWNHGFYLVDGLGHCGGCHTPRNLAGGEERSRAFQGGVAEGWNAPALDGSNPSAKAWTADTLFTYLRTGLDPAHSAAAGPMGPLVHDLAEVPEAEVKAIAVYISSLSRGQDGPITDRADEAARASPAGAVLFAGACGCCHGAGAAMLQQGRPSLSLVGAIQEDDPRNALQAILQGIPLPAGTRGAYMPAFVDSLSDGKVAEIAAYLRARFSVRPAWTGLDSAVAAARKESAEP